VSGRARAREREIPFGAEDLCELRELVASWASGHRLQPARVAELVLAVNELASNSVRYGGGRGTLRMWREDDLLLCEVHDRGRLADPCAGRLRPRPDGHSGRGLWIVNQVCDVVQMRSSEAGTSICVHKALKE
jgi:anti-sigma regulatory factor (Ser/Thr protein kinase)